MTIQILDAIQSPADLKKLKTEELYSLAKEIRSVLINTVSKTGGHLAPNLGVVELTLALHSVFNCPEDKLIWDVGHQSYVHKLLTGRREKFSSLRQLGGISGFPKRGENECDSFDTGHSSTSISAAVGMAVARDLSGKKHEIVAVIGDGAMTGGIALEALNHAGHLGTKMVVVLNDNEMSISENVGALAGYLSRMRTDPRYYKQKEEMELLIKKIPAIGTTVVRAVERIKDSFKYLVVPGMLFEELGFTYLGPINGHDIALTKTILQRAKNSPGPVLVHVITKKGKGYKPAEENPDKFHGVGTFDVKTGKTPEPNRVSYTEVFGQALCEMASANKKVLAISAAMPTGTGLTDFRKKFPERFFDVGIAEQHAVTMAASLALSGYIPVVAIYSTFLQRAYDQILHDVALQGLHVIFAIDRAGLVGEDGETHQGVFDISYLRHIPGMVIMAPKDENELKNMLLTAVEYNGPVAVRYPRGTGTGVTLKERPKSLPIGRAEVLGEGADLTIAAIGPSVNIALDAAKALKEKGIQAAVINARFIKPLDCECIKASVEITGRLITIEENVLAGGFGSTVIEFLSDSNIKAQVKRIGIPDEFVCHGPVKELREKHGLSPEKVVAVAVDLLNGRGKKASPRRNAEIKLVTQP